MAFKDLRGFISRLEEEGELQRIEGEVDWNLEAAGITRRCIETGAPAPFFQKIKGFPGGYRMLGSPLSTTPRRIALAMEMRPDTSIKEIIEEFNQRVKHPMKPLLVTDGPCKENVHLGNEVNLEEFPAPLLSKDDGGRYMSTWSVTIVKDLDSDWVNWGTYRQMLVDKKTLVNFTSPSQQIGQIYYNQYESRNESMEAAVVIGPEPACIFAAGYGAPVGVNEVDLAGAIRKEPVELVKCETIDLYVPANAEIVIEGIIPPRERGLEGPTSCFSGYLFPGGELSFPLFHVKAITHRNDPILTFTSEGTPRDDAHSILSITQSASILEDLKSRGFPVKMVYLPPDCCLYLVAVATEIPYPNFAWIVASAIWARANPYQHVMIVDADIDVTDWGDLMHAFVTKCHPLTGIQHVKRAPAIRTESFLSFPDRMNGVSSYILYDCTWPKEWDPNRLPVKMNFDTAFPKEIKEKILNDWGDYGFSI